MFETDDDLRKYSRVLLAFFRARLAQKHQHEAEDLAQSVLLAAWGRGQRESREPVRDVPAYLLGIARNTLADFLRTEIDKRKESLDDPALAERIGRIVQCSRDDSDRLVAHVRAILPTLPAIELEVLTLRIGAGLSNEETAKRLGISPDDTSRIKWRALNTIRRRVEARIRRAS